MLNTVNNPDLTDEPLVPTLPTLAGRLIPASSVNDGAQTGPELALKRRLIVVGGRDAMSEAIAIKLANFVTTQLRIEPDVATVLTAVYNGSLLDDSVFDLQLSHYYGQGKSSLIATAAAAVARGFAEDLIGDLPDLPCLATAERSSEIERLREKFITTTLFGFSLGSIVLHHFDECMRAALSHRGLTDAENDDLRRRLAIVTIGDVAFGRCQTVGQDSAPLIPTINVSSTRDFFAAPSLPQSWAPRDAIVFLSIAPTRIAITAPLAGDWFEILATSQTPGEVQAQTGEATSTSAEADEPEYLGSAHDPNNSVRPNEHLWLLKTTDTIAHRPAVYLKPKFGSMPGHLFIPTALAEIVHKLLSRLGPVHTTADLLKWEPPLTPLGFYYKERAHELAQEL